MLDDVGVQGSDHAEIVGDGLEVGKQFTHHQPGLAAGVELERRPEQGQRFGFVRAQSESGNWLAVAGLQFGLGIERVEMGKATGQENENQLSLGGSEGLGAGDARRSLAAASEAKAACPTRRGQGVRKFAGTGADDR